MSANNAIYIRPMPDESYIVAHVGTNHKFDSFYMDEVTQENIDERFEQRLEDNKTPEDEGLVRRAESREEAVKFARDIRQNEVWLLEYGVMTWERE